MDRRSFLTASLAALAAPIVAKAAAAAAPLPADDFCMAVSARGPVSITLPAAMPGSTISVLNAGGHDLRVYPPAGWVRTLSPGQQVIYT